MAELSEEELWKKELELRDREKGIYTPEFMEQVRIQQDIDRKRHLTTGQESFGEQVLYGVGESGDYVTTGIRQLWNDLTGDEEELKQLTSDYQERQKQAEKLDSGARLIGNLSAGAVVPGFGAIKGASLLQKALNLAKYGAAEGAALGYVAPVTNSDEAGAFDAARFENAGLGALIGGVAAPTVAGGIAGTAKLGKMAVAPFKKTNVNTEAGKVLDFAIEQDLPVKPGDVLETGVGGLVTNLTGSLPLIGDVKSNKLIQEKFRNLASNQVKSFGDITNIPIDDVFLSLENIAANGLTGSRKKQAQDVINKLTGSTNEATTVINSARAAKLIEEHNFDNAFNNIDKVLDEVVVTPSMLNNMNVNKFYNSLSKTEQALLPRKIIQMIRPDKSKPKLETDYVMGSREVPTKTGKDLRTIRKAFDDILDSKPTETAINLRNALEDDINSLLRSRVGDDGVRAYENLKTRYNQFRNTWDDKNLQKILIDENEQRLKRTSGNLLTDDIESLKGVYTSLDKRGKEAWGNMIKRRAFEEAVNLKKDGQIDMKSYLTTLDKYSKLFDEVGIIDKAERDSINALRNYYKYVQSANKVKDNNLGAQISAAIYSAGVLGIPGALAGGIPGMMMTLIVAGGINRLGRTASGKKILAEWADPKIINSKKGEEVFKRITNAIRRTLVIEGTD